MKVSRRYAPLIFGVIQAAITTGIATAIATPSASGWTGDVVLRWLSAWGAAWVAMLPVVIVLAPVIKRAVDAMTAPDPVSKTAE